MSDTENAMSDLEFQGSYKKNGYTYLGKGSPSSTIKVMLTTLLVAIVFLSIGFYGGYFFGLHHWLAPDTSYPAAPGDGPQLPQFPQTDENPFKPFMRNGIRYGGDYGTNTINHPIVSSHRRLSTEEKETLCDNRRCCHPTNGVSDEEGAQCSGLALSACCELQAKDICDWNCEEDTANVNEDHTVRDGRKRNKMCHGHGDQDEDEFTDDSVDTPPEDGGSPKDVEDLEQKDDVFELDQCGDEFEFSLDDETAEEEFDEDKDATDGTHDGNSPSRRRMAVYGEDSREAVTSASWPQSHIGLIVFGSGYICSGTKISKKHVITAGHCCHSGGTSGSWYSGWKWYPGVRYKSQVTSSNAVNVIWVNILSGWYYSATYDYDICWLTLAESDPYYLGYGYSTGITTSVPFDIYGYPGDKYWSGGLIKWGHDVCYPSSLTTNQFHYTCDTYGGMSGSGVYYQGNWKVYCIHSYASGYGYNGCCRLTADKFNTLYDSVVAGGGYS